ncbi:putative CmcJ-like methyltransferase [Aspergillus tubingensis]|uniref:putative CmcJ-like methyltransferase n=1 Tax=Aspergillus tubingensis TaxID=5068 RepID=UPI0015799D39|nr:putative CmcJ-like methyltransferase [Aspergillus tubingensis]GFN20345.1 putative CmcJ-like methyltransferase [Aspergillus tubingensis]
MSYIDVHDEDKIRDTLYAEVKQVLQRLTGASIVHIWSHVVRGKYADGIKPNEKAHIDTAESWRQDLFRQYCTKPDSNIAPSAKYEFYNLWLPLLPVKNYPLAFCEPSSVDPDDILPVIYHGNDVPGQNCLLQHSKSQKWCYKSNQQPSEAWIFYQGAVANLVMVFDKGVPHASFRLDGSGAPRQSIEFKAMVFF